MGRSDERNGDARSAKEERETREREKTSERANALLRFSSSFGFFSFFFVSEEENRSFVFVLRGEDGESFGSKLFRSDELLAEKERELPVLLGVRVFVTHDETPRAEAR